MLYAILIFPRTENVQARHLDNYVGSEVLPMMIMMNIVFWDVMLYSLQRFSDISEEHIASVFRVKE